MRARDLFVGLNWKRSTVVAAACLAGILLAISVALPVPGGRKLIAQPPTVGKVPAPPIPLFLLAQEAEGLVAPPPSVNLDPVVVRSINEITRSVNRKIPSPFSFLDNPSYWTKKAQGGDVVAALLVYDTVVNCTQLTSDGAPRATTRVRATSSTDCSGLPREIVSDPLKWLEIGARAGDVESALRYGLNARVQASADPIVRQRQDEAALSYLSYAATAGVREAYIALYEAHTNGSFGLRDPALGFAYLAALERMDPKFPYFERLGEFRNKLNTADKLRAELLVPQIVASCCNHPLAQK